jgi:hypothetical protein
MKNGYARRVSGERALPEQASLRVPANEAVDYVRQRYNRGAVETSRQRSFVARFS